MWTCQLCQHDTDDSSTMCEKCHLRRDATSVSGDTLCVLHSTTYWNYNQIRTTGFRITVNPLAGRSMGDVIYGYSYTGGEINASVNHGVNACWTDKKVDFAVFQILFNYSLSEVIVFDQPAWDALLDQNPSLTNYQALRRVCGDSFAQATKQVLEEKNRQRKKEQGEEASVPNVENVRPDHMSEAAFNLGARAFYMLGTGIITFFYPQDLGAGDVWIRSNAPAQGNSLQAKGLLDASNLIAAGKYREFAQPPKVPKARVDNLRRGLEASGYEGNVDKRAQELATKHPGLRYRK
jgi:hypothetical protein